ncbi:MAG: hypothetical protein ACAH21_11150 [Ramlibacter sp.]|nr:hypothetical protein [Ramlibacter sp.]
MKHRLFAALFAVAGMLSGAAHAQAPAKIAVSSLIGDTLTVTIYREASGSNLSNVSNVYKMNGPLLDITALKTVQQALAKAEPKAEVFPLKVAAAGSPTDPAATVADDKVVADNVLVQALRQQGFTHLVTATKYRHTGLIRLADGPIHTGKGQMEGLGFYLDPSLQVQGATNTVRSEGIIAPYIFVQVRLIDLATMEVRTQPVIANGVVAAAQNKQGTDAWGALTPDEKFKASESLIQVHVAKAVLALFAPK